MCRNLHISRGQSAVTSCVTRALKSTQNLNTGFDEIRVFDECGAVYWHINLLFVTATKQDDL